MADVKVMIEFNLSCPVPRVSDDRIVLAHGGGGRLTHQLIEKIFMPAFGNPMLEQRHDGAVLPLEGVKTGSRHLWNYCGTTGEPVLSPRRPAAVRLKRGLPC